MGFLDKVKNMFTEEVEDDVKVEQIKKEVTHVAIDSPNAKDDDFEERVVNNYEDEIKQKTSKPVFFDDNDFRDLNLVSEPKVEEKPKIVERELYNNRVEKEPEEKKIFKPTPIISPVYGILDKNYHKEDIVSKNDIINETKSNTLGPSIDSIRNKAYGTLEDELENTLFGTNSILFKKEETKEEVEINEVEEDVLTNLTADISKELDELLIKKEKYIDEEIEEDNTILSKENEDDLLEFIDSTLYKNGEDE